jgi:hypothetical protein
MKLGEYRHYKRKIYEVIGEARHSETYEELVIYRVLFFSEEFGVGLYGSGQNRCFLRRLR